MKYYAVFDTNVIISSLLTKRKDSATAKVVDAVAAGRIIPLYDINIIDEYETVLRRDKFPFSEAAVERIIMMIQSFGIFVEAKATGSVLPDEDDVVFYDIVMEKRDDNAYLITGNLKHFPNEPCIVTPAEMMAIIESNEDKRELP